ncbi:MAG: hypothetical protein BWY16_00148 [Candidatus Omnitrophica bacterium ADurb.Bin205]|nr:MAG: hypothetical protein BWY16_00148 [Candidatus Omnitrophica bacterium ADurb.Bin205]
MEFSGVAGEVLGFDKTLLDELFEEIVDLAQRDG